jgi:hypothetical protein
MAEKTMAMSERVVLDILPSIITLTTGLRVSVTRH